MIEKTMRNLFYAGLISLLCATSAQAVDITAAAATITMPGGETVTMWGYSVPADPNYATPFGANGPPVITGTAGSTLSITLTNNLAVPTSLVINGQTASEAGAMTPTWTDNTTGSRANTGQRVRSFTHEAAPAASVTYTWSPLKAGTYLIESGTHPGVQVPMGLYAVLVVDAGADIAYNPASGPITYNNEATLLFSEVDPYLHAAVVDGTYGTAAYETIMKAGYRPRYFMINGRPYSASDAPYSIGNVGETTMLRFANAGLRPRMPILQGGRLQLIAEDGNLFTEINGQLQQFNQHSVDLLAGKTLDAVFTNPATPDYIAVYDRRLALTNDATADGGMMVFLEVGTPNHALTVAANGTGSGTIKATSQPGGIDFPSDTSESFVDGTEVRLHAEGAAGSTLSGWSVSDGAPTGECSGLGDCVVVMTTNKTVTATFTSYSAVTVISPNGGENIPGATGYMIRWGAPANAVIFNLGYNFGGGRPWKTIALGVTGTEYLWVIPEVLPNNGDLNVAVIGYDVNGNKVGYDISDAAAQRYSMALLSPNTTGISMTVGSTYSVTWNSNLVPGTISSIALWYQTAPGGDWQRIERLTTDTGSYDWTVPAETTTSARVGIVFYNAAGETLYMDVSDNLFTMTP